MQPDPDADNRYWGTIPGQAEGEIVEFFVEAVDARRDGFFLRAASPAGRVLEQEAEGVAGAPVQVPVGGRGASVEDVGGAAEARHAVREDGPLGSIAR